MSATLPLRDIQLPPEPGWWPPAPGWWLLVVVFGLLLWWLLRQLRHFFYRLRDRRRRVALLDAALARSDPDSSQAVAAANVCLRQVALQEAPDAARLQGDAWLEFLDRDLPDAPFSNGPGRLLAEGGFRPQVDPAAVDALIALVRLRLERGLR